MALLNNGMEDMQPMDMPSQRMISSAPEPSVLDQILGGLGTVAKYALPGLAIPAMAIKDAYSSRDAAKQSMQDMKGMSYAQLAQYWAERGDAQKAQQYAELAQAQNPKTREVFSRTENVVDDNGQTGVLLTYRNGEQEFKPVQYAPNAGPASRSAATPRVPVGMMWNPETGRAEQIPGVPVKAAPMGRAPSASTSTAAKAKGLPPVERSKVEAKANMYAMARKNIDRLSSIVRTADPVQLADPRSTVGAQAASLATQIQDAYRVMADLGVINEADVPRIENVVPGATSLPTIAKGKAAALEKYRVFGKELDQGLANLGYRVRKPANGESRMADYSSKYGLKPRDGK